MQSMQLRQMPAGIRFCTDLFWPKPLPNSNETESALPYLSIPTRKWLKAPKQPELIVSNYILKHSPTNTVLEMKMESCLILMRQRLQMNCHSESTPRSEEHTSE